MTTRLTGDTMNETRSHRSSSVWRNRHLWYVSVLTLAISILSYLEWILNSLGLPHAGGSTIHTAHNLHNFLFFLPILYAAYIFKVRGTVIAGVITLIVTVPHHIVFPSPPLSPLLTDIASVSIATLMGIALAIVRNQREQIRKAYAAAVESAEALRNSEEKLRLMFESVTDGITVIDLNGIIAEVNERTVEMHGFSSKDELLGRSALEFVAPQDHKSIAANMQEALKQGAIRDVEYTLLKADGSEFPSELSTSVLKDGSGKLVGHITIIRDITKRKLAVETLRRNEEKFRVLLENLPQKVFHKDKNLIYVSCNNNYARDLGINPDEILGKTDYDFYPLELAEKHRDDDKRILEFGKTEDIEETYIQDGREVIVHTVKTPIKDEEGNIIGILGIFWDITEQKKLEAEKKELEQKAQLASRLASIGEMASGIAHEINNPLTSVIGFSQLLMTRDIPDDMRNDLGVINREAQRVAKIVAGLLTFARRRKPGRECVDINDIVSRVLELRAYEMKVNDIQVVTQLATDLPHTMADANQLQQVFLNIVLNAEQAMTEANHRGMLIAKTEKIGGSIRVSFADDGPGISKESLGKVFDPLFTTKEVGKGIGLGLSICHGIVTAHKGRIYAASELGKGATFVVELPIVANTEPPKKAEAMPESWQRSGAKILVVDDEATILDLLRCLLTKQGYKVETVDRAQAALERFNGGTYDVILLDIKMPVMSGIELYHHIEVSNPALAQRVMFITGDVIEATTRDFLGKTKVAYIAKPLDMEQLKKEINRILTKSLVIKK